MKKSVFTLLTALAALAFVGAAGNAEDDKPKKKEVTTTTCPVAGKEIKIAEAKTVSYKDANVYVCCDKCKAKMEEDAKPFAAKANQQLVQTRQYRQVKCPLTGGPIDKEEKAKVGATMVRFCCSKCQGKVAAAEGDVQRELVFNDNAFEKGFKAVKKKTE
jgi:hypothetical protein